MLGVFGIESGFMITDGEVEMEKIFEVIDIDIPAEEILLSTE